MRGGPAPFPLTTYEETRAYAAPAEDAVVSRRMPPWLAAQGCAEYAGDESLSDAQVASIAAWVDAGTPEGEPSAAPLRRAGAGREGLSRVDRTLAMPEEYAPANAPDDYRCFLVRWPETEDRFVTGFRANPGNARIVHHVIAFLVQPESVATYEELDRADEGPGYTCFGGPGGPDDRRVAWVGAWAPAATAATSRKARGSASVRARRSRCRSITLGDRTWSGANGAQSGADATDSPPSTCASRTRSRRRRS